jgi:hypothetical protein
MIGRHSAGVIAQADAQTAERAQLGAVGWTADGYGRKGRQTDRHLGVELRGPRRVREQSAGAPLARGGTAAGSRLKPVEPMLAEAVALDLKEAAVVQHLGCICSRA